MGNLTANEFSPVACNASNYPSTATGFAVECYYSEQYLRAAEWMLSAIAFENPENETHISLADILENAVYYMGENTFKQLERTLRSLLKKGEATANLDADQTDKVVEAIKKGIVDCKERLHHALGEDLRKRTLLDQYPTDPKLADKVAKLTALYRHFCDSNLKQAATAEAAPA